MRIFLFACIHNAGRSQMSAAFFNRLADPSKARAISAGTQPAECVQPFVVDGMRELGIDVSNARPQKLTVELAQEAALLITMGCGEQCPYVPGLRRIDWSLKDPNGLPLDEVRAIRDTIQEHVKQLVSDEGLMR